MLHFKKMIFLEDIYRIFCKRRGFFQKKELTVFILNLKISYLKKGDCGGEEK